MVVSGYKEKEGEIRSPFVALTTTKSALHTTNIKPWSKDRQGKLISRLHDKERILTHAAALQIISKRTSIPVPKLLGFGENPDGTAWIEVERTHGGIWLDLVGEECRMPPGKQHIADGGECDECARIAETNASRYIRDEILPQLHSLRSDTTGLEGIVIPPLWIMDYDPKTSWQPKKAPSGKEEYVFCHGNLHAHSILMHAETLHVMKVVDWDNAGYFPQEFQRWTVQRGDYEELFENKERCKELSNLML
ncbi:hypothetical protein NEMBOFW57_007858 [Staphylotrichum longicolle]|uniref:Aminoglycoside phosphotransferase domain-containing protein n=1 Tax=Staphylotrichum longicolle TaxID=669026 RepID=A0AAD4EVN1_9PEZI|nr:hypothetical protein NEMBOFW57_007858 [Staphylotrichum longicolle]